MKLYANNIYEVTYQSDSGRTISFLFWPDDGGICTKGADVVVTGITIWQGSDEAPEKCIRRQMLVWDRIVSIKKIDSRDGIEV